jgi:hypothetical protein
MPILGIMASSRPAFELVGSYDSLATVTLSAATASITFAGIPSGYKHLQVRATYAASGAGVLKLTVNSDTGANYKSHWLYGDGAAAYGGVSSVSPNAVDCGYIGSANNFGASIIDILDYTNTNKYKTTRALSGNDRNGAGDIELSSGLWMNTNSIISINLVNQSGNLNQYSSFALYGIK